MWASDFLGSALPGTMRLPGLDFLTSLLGILEISISPVPGPRSPADRAHGGKGQASAESAPLDHAERGASGTLRFRWCRGMGRAVPGVAFMPGACPSASPGAPERETPFPHGDAAMMTISHVSLGLWPTCGEPAGKSGAGTA